MWCLVNAQSYSQKFMHIFIFEYARAADLMNMMCCCSLHLKDQTFKFKTFMNNEWNVTYGSGLIKHQLLNSSNHSGVHRHDDASVHQSAEHTDETQTQLINPTHDIMSSSHLTKLLYYNYKSWSTAQLYITTAELEKCL